jgi:DNA repair protein RecN (Recombination protein N)
MLKSLLIENYALIEKLDISFDDGLTIITGETGAGKSILLGALGLILGQRADTRVLFDKDSKCIIEGVFSISDLQMDSLFMENDLDYEPVTILRREITPQGKSRAFINDTPVNLNVMKLFAERLIDIHSQHQSLLFSNSAFRYNLLDAWAGINNKMVSYRQEFGTFQADQKMLEELLQQEKQSRAELDYLLFQHDELFKAGLIPNETDEIGAELEILNHAGEIKYNLEKADYILQNSPENILSSLGEVINLFRAIEKYDQSYAETFSRLQSSLIELKDIANELIGMTSNISDDPARVARLQQRFDLLQKLLHKHNARDVDELIQIKDNFGQKIESFESLEKEIETLRNQCNTREAELFKQARIISELRSKSIPALEKEINGILKELGMPNGQFRVKLMQQTILHLNGIDDLDFLFSANLGAAPQELAKVASGGELSRLMLAIKSVISLKNLLPTIIFDEIDTGVSGEIGFKMGNILSKISHNMQVISVTHLPQVAAKGKKHFVVYKNIENHTTKTFVKEVRDQDRVLEIAHMLGGENPGPALLHAAEELFDKQNINKN